LLLGLRAGLTAALYRAHPEGGELLRDLVDEVGFGHQLGAHCLPGGTHATILARGIESGTQVVVRDQHPQKQQKRSSSKKIK
jgi:hypothetical protein